VTFGSAPLRRRPAGLSRQRRSKPGRGLAKRILKVLGDPRPYNSDLLLFLFPVYRCNRIKSNQPIV